jgi:AcrR family transcriptional regulator
MATSVPDQLTPRAREIVNAARELLEEEGLEALSMRRIGQRLGIRAPSIYKHLPDKDALKAAIISTGSEEQAALFEAALQHADDPLGALARAYRNSGRERPHLYRLMTDRTLNRELLVPGSEERAALPLYKATGENLDLARAAWAVGHGMTILELNSRFPPRRRPRRRLGARNRRLPPRDHRDEAWRTASVTRNALARIRFIRSGDCRRGIAKPNSRDTRRGGEPR